MTKVEQIEQQLRRLSEEEPASFGTLFSEFEAARWDAQFKGAADVRQLDALAVAARADQAAGRLARSRGTVQKALIPLLWQKGPDQPMHRTRGQTARYLD